MKPIFLELARRQLFSTSRLGIRFMTTMSILGVGAGVMVLVVVLSIMGGFENRILQRFVTNEPHAEILAVQEALGFPKNEISLEGVLDHEAFIKADVVIKHGRHMAGAELLGLEVGREKHIWAVTESIVNGDATKIGTMVKPFQGETSYPAILLGFGLAQKLNVDIGGVVSLLNVAEAEGGAVPIMPFTVAGVFESSEKRLEDNTIVVGIPHARKFLPEYSDELDQSDVVSGIAVKISRPMEIEQFQPKIDPTKHKILTWKNVNSAMLFALKLERYAMAAVLMLVVLVAAFSIATTLIMTTFHRRSQIKLLRALGASQKDIVILFTSHGVMIGLVGVALGMAAGLVACGILSMEMIPRLPLTFAIRHIPVVFVPKIYAMVCLCAFVVTVLASILPALAASRQKLGWD